MLPKKYSNPIEVEGRQYRWMVGEANPTTGLASFIIEDAAGFPIYCESIQVLTRDASGKYTIIKPVTPADVTSVLQSLVTR